MDAITKTINRARVRLFGLLAVRGAGYLALAGLVTAMALLLADRLLPVMVPGWGYALVGAAVVAGALGLAWWRLPSREAAAVLLDDRLHLKDRLSTALYLRASGQALPFSQEVIDDAEHAATGLAVREAVPMRPGRAWGWVPVGAGVFALMAVLVPGGADPFGLQDRQQQQAMEEAGEEADEDQARARRAVDRREPEAADPESQDPEDLLAELASLTDRDLRHPELRREQAAKLSSLQDRLAQAREQEERQLRTVQNAMSGLDAERGGPADRLTDAMRRGDFEAAQRELQSLSDRMQDGDMSEGEREALSEQLGDLEQQLEEMAERAREQQERLEEQIEDRLRESGLSEQQIEDLKEQGYDRESVQEALEQANREQGMDDQEAREQAQQEAEQVQQQQQQAEQQEALGECASGLCDSMGQMGSSAQGQGQSGGGGQFDQGAWEAQQRLAEMAQMQERLREMGEAEEQAQQAMEQASEGDQGDTAGQQQQPQQMAGSGGQEGGPGVGGDPMGEERAIEDYETQVRDRSESRAGRVLASWQQEGESRAGESQRGFDEAVSEARSEAEQAVSGDRVPRRYQGAVRDYFQQLPESAEGDGE